MKSLHLLLLFAFCLGVRASNRKDEMWENQCKANTTDYPEAVRELQTAYNNLPECVQQIPYSPGWPNEKTDSQKFCTADGLKTSRQCFENFTQKLSRCLSANEKFMEDLVMATYTNIMEDMCSGGNLEKFEDFINQIWGNFVKKQSFLNIIENCGIQLEFYKTIDSKDDLIFSKTEFCSDLSSMKQCTLTGFQKGVLSDLSDTLEKISSPILRWCKKHG